MSAPASASAVREQLLDNEEVRVIATTYPPAAGVAMHEHPYPHVAYVIEGGTVETTGPDGRTQRLALAPGRTLWREPQSHSTRNVGDTPVRIVEVEIKHAGAARAAEPRPRIGSKRTRRRPRQRSRATRPHALVGR